MKSGDRLDQLEPLIVEMLIKIDATASKVDYLAAEVSNLKIVTNRTIDIVIKQSDSISFLIQEQLKLSNKIDNIDGRLDNIDGRLDNIDGRLDNIDIKFDVIDSKFDVIDKRFDSMDTKLDNMEITQQSILSLLRNKH